MTVFDYNMQVGVMLVPSYRLFYYYDASVKYNTLSRALEASVESDRTITHPWRIEYDNLFSSLEKYYNYVAGAISQRDVNTLTGRFVHL